MALTVLEENALSKEEVIGIQFMVYMSWNKDAIPFDCDDCNDPLRSHSKSYTQSEKDREVRRVKCNRGCTGTVRGSYADGYIVPFSGDKNIHKAKKWFRCPRLFEKTHITEWLLSYEMFKAHNICPVSGGMEAQPNKWVEAMQLIGSEMARNENAKNKEATDKARKQSNKVTTKRR